jgi:single-strand DNA-binding protein
MLNSVNLVGRLTKDLEVKYSASGVAFGTFTLAVDRAFKNKQGEKETDFISIVVLGKTAEHCSNYIGKGSLISVSGRIQTRTYDTKEGQRRYVTEVLAEQVNFLDRRENNRSGDQEFRPQQTYNQPSRQEDLYPVDIEEDELPF